MTTTAEIRLANLELLIACEPTLDALAVKVGSSSVYFSQLRKRAVDIKTGRPREMGSQMARRLEAACAKPRGWMDEPHAALPDRQADTATGVKDLTPLTTYEALQWPFEHVSRSRIAALSESNLAVLEHVMLETLAKLQARSKPSPSSGKHQRVA